MPQKINQPLVRNLIPQEMLERKIFIVRGQKVMLDRDLAELYGVETRALNQAVRRNIERFPVDFLFALTRKEIMNLSHIVISSNMKHAPNVFAFSEQGIAMLSSVLRSSRAIQVNITIMRVFVRLKEMVSIHKELAKKLKQLEGRVNIHDRSIRAIFEAIRPWITVPEKPKRHIGFHGESKQG